MSLVVFKRTGFQTSLFFIYIYIIYLSINSKLQTVINSINKDYNIKQNNNIKVTQVHVHDFTGIALEMNMVR